VRTRFLPMATRWNEPQRGQCYSTHCTADQASSLAVLVGRDVAHSPFLYACMLPMNVEENSCHHPLCTLVSRGLLKVIERALGQIGVLVVLGTWD